MRYQDYSTVTLLSTELLEELLSTGDSQERVWAAWEIAMRLGKESLPKIFPQDNKFPDPGVRLHMVVILAGLGNYSVLSTLAFNDPDDAVRGASAQYLIRTANPNDVDRHDLIVKLLKEDESPVVKESILRHWKSMQQTLPIKLLLENAENKSEGIRAAAIELITTTFVSDELEKDDIIACLAVQNTRESVSLLSNWLEKFDLQDLILLSAEKSDQSSCLLILDFFVEKKSTVTWSLLSSLAKRNKPEINIRLLSILKSEFDLHLMAWLALGIALSINLPRIKLSWDNLELCAVSDFYYVGLDHFLFLIKEMEPARLEKNVFDNFKIILANFEESRTDADEYDDEDWEHEESNYEDCVQVIDSNIYHIKRWLGAEMS
ncbi:MAG: HEAT repeat domain-containing protein [Pseudomonadota bacterium]